MARAIPLKFDLVFKVEFQTNIGGHHVYKDVWTPTVGERLNCRKDYREEAKEYDENAIGVYKKTEEEDLLVGHIPIKLSKLMNQYLGADSSNRLVATISGKRKRELCLVVPAKFKCISMKKKVAQILHEELIKKKGKYSYLELVVEDFIARKRIDYT